MIAQPERETLEVNFMGDCIEINGEVYRTLKPVKNGKGFLYQGVYYDTVEEYWMAQMLTWMKITFLHHVKFEFYNQGKKNEKLIWCPDFVFAYPLRWVGRKCNGSVIMGVEVKRRKTSGARKKSRILLKERGIPIIILKRKDIKPHFNKFDMELPLKPLDEYKELYMAQAG